MVRINHLYRRSKSKSKSRHLPEQRRRTILEARIVSKRKKSTVTILNFFLTLNVIGQIPTVSCA